MVQPRSHLPSSEAPAPALDNDDILSEILRRLPPLPSSLPRASLVCKRWRRLVSDPHFLRRFREHHRKPPLLGFFSQDKDYNIEFTSTLNPPDNIAASRFFLRVENATVCKILDCRHGRVLVLNWELLYVLVWDPVTDDQQRVALPLLAFRYKNMMFVRGRAIVCAADEEGHVHGACHSSPCQVVLLCHNGKGVFFTWVYSSETGKWGSAITLLCQHRAVAPHFHSTLVGSSIYWLLAGNTFAILESDLCSQSLACTELPPNAADLYTLVVEESKFLIAPANGGGLIFFNLTGFIAKVWKCKVNCDGVSQWVLGNDVDIRTLLSLGPGMGDKFPEILGLVGDDNTMLLQTDAGLFVVHLESMKVKKFSSVTSLSYNTHHPFTSFFSAGHIAEGAPLP